MYGDRQAATSPIYRELRQALGWFRFHWTASLPGRLHEGFSTVEPDDVLGAPAWSDRFRRFLDTAYDVVLEPDPLRTALEATEQSRDPMRQAFDAMARSKSRQQRCAAQFLFRLACLDFEPRSAGLAMAPPLLPEYAYYYAEKAIARLRQLFAEQAIEVGPSGARLVSGPPPAWLEAKAAVG